MVSCLEYVESVLEIVIRILAAINGTKAIEECENLVCGEVRQRRECEEAAGTTNLVIHLLPPGGPRLERVFRIVIESTSEHLLAEVCGVQMRGCQASLQALFVSRRSCRSRTWGSTAWV